MKVSFGGLTIRLSMRQKNSFAFDRDHVIFDLLPVGRLNFLGEPEAL